MLLQILKTQIIEAPSQLRGQFGLAVETLGDINYDGYDDVAISAPYIDSGVVYIFRGSKDGLVTTDYQVECLYSYFSMYYIAIDNNFIVPY